VSIRLFELSYSEPAQELHKSFDFPVSLLSDSISQRASLFTYHLVRPGYSPAPSSRSIPITEKTLISSRTDYVNSGLGYAIRTDFYDELATDRTPLTSSRTCHRHVTPSYDSATNDDLRRCARCGEQRQYCHGHTPVIPNPSLDLPPAQPRAPVSGSVPTHRVARVNLNRAQATALAVNLVNALENNQDPSAILPAYDYGKEISRIVAEGLGLDQVVVAEGLGVRGGGGSRGGQGRGGQPGQVPDARRPANPPQATTSRNRRRPAARPVLPTPPGFEHNRGPSFIPFRIQDNGRETPARYIWAHLDAPNPYVEGRLSFDGPTYHSEIHTAAIHDVDIPPPPITADILRLLHTDLV
jgi:hypothetical protein